MGAVGVAGERAATTVGAAATARPAGAGGVVAAAVGDWVAKVASVVTGGTVCAVEVALAALLVDRPAVVVSTAGVIAALTVLAAGAGINGAFAAAGSTTAAVRATASLVVDVGTGVTAATEATDATEAVGAAGAAGNARAGAATITLRWATPLAVSDESTAPVAVGALGASVAALPTLGVGSDEGADEPRNAQAAAAASASAATATPINRGVRAGDALAAVIAIGVARNCIGSNGAVIGAPDRANPSLANRSSAV